MYSTCLFCKTALGANEAVEAFPVGRRLAFDAATGRLWAVCRRCSRWNLSPLEERWEAIEQCERLYRDTRQRAETENIGLACLPDGVELVRVGRPVRAEMAVWRYGDELKRRRSKHRIVAGLRGTWNLGIGVIGPAVLPLLFGAAALRLYADQRTVARATDAAGRPVEITRREAGLARLVAAPEAEHGWALQIRRWGGTFDVAGAEALRTAGQLLPFANPKGADDEQLRRALKTLEAAGGAQALFRTAAREFAEEKYDGVFVPQSHRLDRAPPEVRLALEMAAHEEAERRALEGELHLLEQAWREAEEIAAISDSLLVPAAVGRALERIRGGARPAAGS